MCGRHGLQGVGIAALRGRDGPDNTDCALCGAPRTVPTSDDRVGEVETARETGPRAANPFAPVRTARGARP
ncbi:hypothetical protein GCM10010250_06940 [Streptomyces althioticus]|nr:hypothetical protein GCM10010250_06940 [Streptomyces althioticus]GGQ94295.1 hypothetical protein GCM10010267_66250 [Streptomyces griseorubens]GGT37615.1 hypothetical protein GCM10010243_13190 [Streptomyces matensis]